MDTLIRILLIDDTPELHSAISAEALKKIVHPRNNPGFQIGFSDSVFDKHVFRRHCLQL